MIQSGYWSSRNRKCLLSMEKKLACFYYYPLIKSRLSRPSMLCYHQNKQGFVSYCRDKQYSVIKAFSLFLSSSQTSGNAALRNVRELFSSIQQSKSDTWWFLIHLLRAAASSIITIVIVHWQWYFASNPSKFCWFMLQADAWQMSDLRTG